MALPSERIAAASSRAAFGAMLRLAAVWLAFSIATLGGVGLRALVVVGTDPGDGDGALSALVRLFRSDGGGETWAAAFLLISLVVFAVQAGLLVWAVRRGDREDSLALLIGLGICGLLARLAVFGANLGVHVLLSNLTRMEDVAAYGVANGIAGTLDGLLSWVLALGLFVALLLSLLRARVDHERESPYRAAAIARGR